eukprot:UN02653
MSIDILPVLPLVPIYGVFSVLFTMFMCYSKHKHGNRMQPGEIFPAISELGMFEGKFAYQVGFAVTGFFLSLEMYFFGVVFPPLFPEDALDLISAASRSGVLAGIGCALQGLFTMEPAFTSRSFMHWFGALIFAYQAMNFSQIVLKLHKDFDCEIT